MAKLSKKTQMELRMCELEATAELYLSENLRLQKTLSDLQQKANMQAAEILVFVDHVKQEREATEAHVLNLETKLNEAWGFITDLKDTFEDDTVVLSLLDKHFGEEDATQNGYSN